LINDLERPVFEKYLFLADLKQWLMQQPELEGALMSGSGATVFGVIRNGANIEALRLRLEREFGSEIWVRECEALD
jgi:4-diphosphocytidyl-2-C-methyl-D-erythritol kinase